MAFPLFAASLCFVILIGSISSQRIFSVDLSSKPSRVWKFWESGTTEDHGYLALRFDWRQQLQQTHEDLHIEWVRFHNIFDDDIGMVNPRSPGPPYSYINADKIYDHIVSIGMKPLVELDFLPSSFVATPEQTSALYEYPVYVGPPKNYTQWYYFVQSFVQHLVDRYGMDTVARWAFDAWNEPNGEQNWWHENITTFESTWNQTALAIKSVNTSFRIGSPGSVGMGWIPEFPQWCKDNGVPLDVVSTHMYPTKSGAQKTHNGYYQALQGLSESVRAVDDNLGISLTAYGCTIQNPPNPGPHDTSYNAACFTTFASQFQGLNSSQFEIMSFTGFTDLWDQSGVYSNMFHDSYGWLTSNGVKKPIYWALQLLVDYASDRNYYAVHRNNSNEVNTTLELFVTMADDNKQIALFVMNWMLENHPIADETVLIELSNLGVTAPESGTIYRIDNNHCNPLKTWQEMDSPMYPTAAQIEAISNSSVLIPGVIAVSSKTNNGVTFKVDVPVYGMAVIVIDL